MGEEAFDETVLEDLNGNQRLFVRGCYCREEVYIGIGHGCDDDPRMVVAVDGAELKRALRSMVIGEPRKRSKRHG